MFIHLTYLTSDMHNPNDDHRKLLIEFRFKINSDLFVRYFLRIINFGYFLK